MITLSQVEQIHKILIDKFGGSHGVRDYGTLSSALSRPYSTFDSQELYPTTIQKAAALIESILINHPFVDGNKWSSAQMLAGMMFKAMINGKEILIKGGKPTISGSGNQLHISWPITSFDGTIVMDLDEQNMAIHFTGNQSINWFLELTTASDAVLPFKKISAHKIDAEFDEMNYSVVAKSGFFVKPGAKAVFTIQPENNNVILDVNTVN